MNAEPASDWALIELHSEDFTKIREAFVNYQLEDPNLRLQYEEGMKQFEHIKSQVYGAGKLIRESDPLELRQRHIPERPEDLGLHVPGILASNLIQRRILWDYYNQRIAQSGFEEAKKERKLERFRQEILKLQGDLEPPPARPKPVVSAESSNTFGSYLRRGLHSVLENQKQAAERVRFGTAVADMTQLMQHTSRKIPKVFSRDDLEYFLSSIKDARWVYSTKSEIEYAQSEHDFEARWSRHMRHALCGVQIQYPVAATESAANEDAAEILLERQSERHHSWPEDDNKAREILEHEFIPEELANAEEFKQHPEAVLIQLEEWKKLKGLRLAPLVSEPHALFDIRFKERVPVPKLADLERADQVTSFHRTAAQFIDIKNTPTDISSPDISDCAESSDTPRSQISKPFKTETWIIPMQDETVIKINSHLSIHGSEDGPIYLRYRGRSGRHAQFCPEYFPDKDSILDFELPPEYRQLAALRVFLHEITAIPKADHEELAEKGLGSRFTQFLINKSFPVKRIQNCTLQKQILTVNLADNAVLRDIKLDNHAVLRLRGKEASFINVRSISAVLDVNFETLHCQRVFMDRRSYLRGCLGEAHFDEASELHCYAVEADLRKVRFAAADLSHSLNGLTILKDKLSIPVVNGTTHAVLNQGQYEKDRCQMDESFGAEALYNLLCSAPLSLAGRRPTVEIKKPLLPNMCFRITIPDPQGSPNKKLYLAPITTTSREKCFLFSATSDKDCWQKIEGKMHFHDALAMLIDLIYGAYDSGWLRKESCSYFSEESKSTGKIIKIRGSNKL